MSGQSTYTPKSGLEKWIDQRLPLPRLMHDTMTTFPTPRNLNISRKTICGLSARFYGT